MLKSTENTTSDENIKLEFCLRSYILETTNSYLEGTMNTRAAYSLFETLYENLNYLAILPPNFALHLWLLKFRGVLSPLETKYHEDVLQYLAEEQAQEIEPLTDKERRKYKALASALAVQMSAKDPNATYLESPFNFSSICLKDLVSVEKIFEEKETKILVDLTGGSLLHSINLCKAEEKDETGQKRTRFTNDEVLVFSQAFPTNLNKKLEHMLFKTLTRLHPEVVYDLLYTLNKALGLACTSELQGDTNNEKLAFAKVENQVRVSWLDDFLNSSTEVLAETEDKISLLESKIGNTYKRLTLIQRKELEGLYLDTAIIALCYFLKTLHTSIETGKITMDSLTPKKQLDFLLLAYHIFEGTQRAIHNPRRIHARDFLEAKVKEVISLPFQSSLFVDDHNLFYYYAEFGEDFPLDTFSMLENTPRFKFFDFACDSKDSGIDVTQLKSRSYMFYADISSLHTKEERKALLAYLDKLEENGFYFLLVGALRNVKGSTEDEELSTWIRSKTGRFKAEKTSDTKNSINFCFTNYNYEGSHVAKDLLIGLPATSEEQASFIL